MRCGRKMAVQQASAVFEGLPRQFISSLRVLFDILDRDRSGFIFYSDIEKYWDENTVGGLPRGVLASLQKVTAKSGLISFENFVSALRFALFPSTVSRQQRTAFQNEKNDFSSQPRDHPRSVSVPVTLANYRQEYPISGFKGQHSDRRENTIYSPPRGSQRALSPNSSPTKPGPNTATVRPNVAGQRSIYNDKNVHQPNQEVKYVLHGRPLSERDPNQPVTRTDPLKKRPRDRAQSENVSSMIQRFENTDRKIQHQQHAGVPLTKGSKAVSMDAIVPTNHQYHHLSPPSEDKENRRTHSYAHVDNPNEHYAYVPVRSPERHISPTTNQNHYASPSPEKNKSFSPTSPAYAGSPNKSPHFQQPKTHVRTTNYFPPLHEDDEVEQIYSQAKLEKGRRMSPGERNVTSAMQHRDLDPRGTGVAKSSEPVTHIASPPHKGAYRKIREPRRHTLQNGVDFNMVKRMKQLEQERDVLLQGLEAVDRAREWYQKQIQLVQEKQKNIGKSQHMDYSVEAQQERMNFQMARIFEVNQQLQALVESSEKGFPLHMNLAIPAQRLSTDFEDEKMERIRGQNRVLTQDISDKSVKISQLEKEKTMLVRELFEERAKHRPILEDASIM